MRTGALAYVVVVVLGLALLTITGIVLMSNQISDRKSEKSSLESQLSTAQAEADRTKSFADFAALQLSRNRPWPARREPVRLGARPSRAGDSDSARRLAHEPQRVGFAGCRHVERQLVVKLRLVRGLGEHYGAVAPDRRLRGRSRGGARFLAPLGDVDGVTRVSS
jgi:hypothetical protein